MDRVEGYDQPLSKTVFGVAAAYSEIIKDDRTDADVLKYMKDEVQELEDEVLGAEGIDGIFGEAIDVIACAVDMIRRNRPEMTLEQLERHAAAYMELKCQKWLNNVAARKYPHQDRT